MLPEGTDRFMVGVGLIVGLAAVFLLPATGMRLTPAKMPKLPKGVVKYSQVPSGDKSFTSTTIPKGLLKRHNTKDGTWGIINVSSGRLKYTIEEGPHAGEYNVDSETRGVIEPRVYHSVAPCGDEDLSFCVEFYRYPGTGAVDEKRE